MKLIAYRIKFSFFIEITNCFTLIISPLRKYDLVIKMTKINRQWNS